MNQARLNFGPINHTGRGILIHGLHVQARNWDHIVWGNPPYEMGILPRAMLHFWEYGADTIWFGTGASERSGIKESDVILNLLIERKNRLTEFEALRNTVIDIALTPQGLILYTAGRGRAAIVVDVISQNTVDEIYAAGSYFAQNGLKEMVLVTNSTHVSRAMRDAMALRKEHEILRKLQIVAVSADTSYAESSPSDVVIFEPHHRPDRPVFPLHALVKKIFLIREDRLSQFYRDFQTLMSKYLEV